MASECFFFEIKCAKCGESEGSHGVCYYRVMFDPEYPCCDPVNLTALKYPENSECGKHKEQHPLRNILQRLKDEKIAEFKQAQVDKAEKAKKSDEEFRALAEEKERKKYKDNLYGMAERRMKLDEEERARGERETEIERNRRAWKEIKYLWPPSLR